MQASRVFRNVTAAIILGELFSSTLFQNALQQHFSKDGISVYISTVPFRFTIFFAVMFLYYLPTVFKIKVSRYIVKLGLVLWITGQIGISVYLPDTQSMSSLVEVQSAFLNYNYIDAFLVRLGGGIFVGVLIFRTSFDSESEVYERWSFLLLPFIYVILNVPIATPVQDYRSGSMTALVSAISGAYCSLLRDRAVSVARLMSHCFYHGA